MRSSVLAAATISLVVAGCGIRMPLVSHKPETAAAASSASVPAEAVAPKRASWVRIPFLSHKAEPAAPTPAAPAETPAPRRSTWMRIPFLSHKAEARGPEVAKEPKRASMPTRPSCPAMTDAQWKPVMDRAIHKAFDRRLRKRYGDTAVHVRFGWDRDGRDNTVITAHRIGPARYAIPHESKGGRIEVVFKACTGEVLKTRTLSGLERRPRLAPAAPAQD